MRNVAGGLVQNGDRRHQLANEMQRRIDIKRRGLSGFQKAREPQPLRRVRHDGQRGARLTQAIDAADAGV